MAHYYKFTADTPYCGTETVTYEVYETEPAEAELIARACELAEENGEQYDYLVFGWGVNPVEDGEMTEDEYEEEMEMYYGDCNCHYEEVSEDEYLENVG